MKSYDNLTKDEKEKLMMYWQIRSSLSLRLIILTAISYLGLFIALPLIVLQYFPLTVIGIYLLVIVFVVLIMVVWKMQEHDKYLQLAFGTTDCMKDIFGISKSDILGMKKVWVKEKKEKDK